MKAIMMLAALACLTGCATGGTGGPVLPASRLEQVAVPGQTRAQVLAALGPATNVRFDSGKEVRMYRYAGDGDAQGGHGGEFVLLFGADGTLIKVRRGPVWTPAGN